MPDSPVTPAADMDLQALQRKRKQVLALGAAVWLLLLLFTQSRWRTAAPHLHALIEIGRPGPDPGLHPRAHLVHALHRRAQEARAGHRRTPTRSCAIRSMSSARSAPPASARRPAACSSPILFAAGSLAVFPGRGAARGSVPEPEPFRRTLRPTRRACRASGLACRSGGTPTSFASGHAWYGARFSKPASFFWRCRLPALLAWLQQLGHFPVLLNLP